MPSSSSSRAHAPRSTLFPYTTLFRSIGQLVPGLPLAYIGNVSRTTASGRGRCGRSEEHTSELQSLRHLVCRLLLQAGRTPRDLLSFPTRRSSDLLGNLCLDYR